MADHRLKWLLRRRKGSDHMLHCCIIHWLELLCIVSTLIVKNLTTMLIFSLMTTKTTKSTCIASNKHIVALLLNFDFENQYTSSGHHVPVKVDENIHYAFVFFVSTMCGSLTQSTWTDWQNHIKVYVDISHQTAVCWKKDSPGWRGKGTIWNCLLLAYTRSALLVHVHVVHYTSISHLSYH